MNFKGKVALVTGASVGIGRAVALELAEYGADLILLDLDFEKLESVKRELAAYTESVWIYRCDISDEARVGEVITDALEKVGKIDILVNNAALWRGWSSFAQTPVTEWNRFLNVNVMGTVYVTHAVLPQMIAQGYGKIINVASVAGVYGNRMMAAYSASKGAVISFTQALAKEVAENGITVNAVSPGSVSPSEENDVNHSQPTPLSYMGRTGTDRENADLICFLASDRASYISGQNIQIDGCRKQI
ncbi:MAG: SDR family oxidoreductase [Clostridia bacterium]|nr:SDR family oxidoreductase [Clostridia bacterium]